MENHNSWNFLKGRISRFTSIYDSFLRAGLWVGTFLLLGQQSTITCILVLKHCSFLSRGMVPHHTLCVCVCVCVSASGSRGRWGCFRCVCFYMCTPRTVGSGIYRLSGRICLHTHTPAHPHTHTHSSFTADHPQRYKAGQPSFGRRQPHQGTELCISRPFIHD